jgi:hypothetical protein
VNSSLLAHLDFRRLLIAQAVSAVGSRITRTALPIIAVNMLQASATAAPLARSLGYGRAVVLCLGCWILASVFIPASEGQGALVVPFLATGFSPLSSFWW